MLNCVHYGGGRDLHDSPDDSDEPRAHVGRLLLPLVRGPDHRQVRQLELSAVGTGEISQ